MQHSKNNILLFLQTLKPKFCEVPNIDIDIDILTIIV